MESYVTRIGDVTIERVLPKRKPEESKELGEEEEDEDEEEEEEENLEDEEAEERRDEDEKMEDEREDFPMYPPPPSSEPVKDDEVEPPPSSTEMGEEEVAPVSVMESEDLLRDIKNEPQEEEEEEEEDEEEEEGEQGEEPDEEEGGQERNLEGEEESGKLGEEEGGVEVKQEPEDPDDQDQDSLKRKSSQDDSDEEGKAKKKKTGEEGEGESDKGGPERKLCNLRKNIREVMDETQLDEATLAAQRQEVERLRRVQDQQKYIREVQRQMAISRQTKTQSRVLSLLQGTSLKTVPGSSKPSTVLVKVSSSGGGSQVVNRKVLEVIKGGRSQGPIADVKPGILRLPSKPHMVTPSVSIAPVKPTTPLEPPKPKDVVTISSSDEDDCIVISEPSDEEIEARRP